MSPPGPGGWGISYRPARPDDLPACGEIWRDSLNDYLGRLRQPPVGEDLAPIGRLHAHLRSTDPDRFWVAARDGLVIGFGSAALRGPVWFLSMLFVRPSHQGAGIGSTLLERMLPGDGSVLATGTDSAQPISNALYARLGIVPRLPLFSLVGRPSGPAAMPGLPDDVEAVRFASIPTDELVGLLDALDRSALGFAHPQDHRWLDGEGREGFLYRGREGSVVGYGYTSAVGRVGPVAVHDPELLAPVLGHLLHVVEPRGASAVWASGSAMRVLLEAGLRVEGFPVLFCWNRAFADFERYLPISPGLL
jgi:GNAT superfamily N-acetyltransferase